MEITCMQVVLLWILLNNRDTHACQVSKCNCKWLNHFTSRQAAVTDSAEENEEHGRVKRL